MTIKLQFDNNTQTVFMEGEKYKTRIVDKKNNFVLTNEEQSRSFKFSSNAILIYSNSNSKKIIQNFEIMNRNRRFRVLDWNQRQHSRRNTPFNIRWVGIIRWGTLCLQRTIQTEAKSLGDNKQDEWQRGGGFCLAL